MGSPLLTVLLVALIMFPGSAGAQAQDPAQLADQAGKLLDSFQFEKALTTYLAIPDTASADLRLSRHTGATLSLINMGRADEARPHIEQARQLVEQVGTDQARVKFLNAEGLYQDDIQAGDRGMSSLLKAADIAERAGAKGALRSVYSNLSRVYQNMEDWERSTYYNQKAFDLVASPTPVQRFTFHIQRGIAFFEMYERDLAEAEFLRAQEMAAQTKRVRDRAFVRGELAYLYWTFDRDAARALPLYTEGIAAASEAKVAQMTANWLNNRGGVYRDTGELGLALADFEEALRILEAGGMGNTAFATRKNIAQTIRLQGRTAEAASALERLLTERRQQAGMRHLWQAHMELASAYATLGDRRRAEAEFEAMLAVLEEHRSTAILDVFRTGTLAHQLRAYDPYERYIRFLVEASPPRIEEALDVAERARARGFLEALASVRGAVAPRLPAPLLAEETRIRRAISTTQERLRNITLTKADIDRLVAELERAEAERDQFLVSLRVEHPALAEARYPTMLTTQAVQASLRDNEIAVTFFLAEPQSFRWVMSREHIVLDRIAGRSAIEKDVARLRELLGAPSSGGEVTTVSARLGTLLFDGITTADDLPMVIVPHGVLHYVPFEVLRVEERMLIEQHAVSYAPSLNALVQLRKTPLNPAPFRVLAIGNPATGNAARLRAADDRSGAPARDVENLALLGPLPFAEQELHAIGRTFRDRTRILSGASARESGLRDAMVPQYPVIHFATHGLVSDVQPKRSGLLLAPEDGEDGLLQMSEIYGLGLHANLVVLSACQTALGREITGEGLIGLSRAFFYAGARSVVATLWNLNDRFAAEFVQRFYRELNAGHTSEEALRRAKLAYINDPRYSHPFYWSSLVMLGDGTRRLVPEPVAPPMGLTLLAVGLAFCALAVTVQRSGRL